MEPYSEIYKGHRIKSARRNLVSYKKDSPSAFQRYVFQKLNKICYKLTNIEEKLDSIEHLSLAQPNLTLAKPNTSIFQPNPNAQTELEEIQIQKCLTIDDLNSFELQLKNKEFFSSVVNTLKLLGGCDINQITCNVLKRVISNSVAEGFSMFGAKKKSSFKVLRFFKVVIVTVRHHKSDATEKEITQVVAKWLVQAKLRRQREEKKINQDKETDSQPLYTSDGEVVNSCQAYY